MNSLLRSPKGQIGAIVGGCLLVVAAAWFLAVSPQRAKVSEAQSSLTAAQADLVQRRLALARPSAAVSIKPSDLYRLTKALPNDTGMSGILLDVNRLAASNKLDFRSITPSSTTLGAGYVQQPLAVLVEGRFADVSHFLGDVRNLVSVRRGRLNARGRMYSVTKVEIGAPGAGKKFPVVQATVTVNAYTFSAPPPAATPDPSTTTDPSTSGTVAAGATP
jgi:hypothetical protein